MKTHLHLFGFVFTVFFCFNIQAQTVCPSVISGDGILQDNYPAASTPLPATVPCNSPDIELEASRNTYFNQFIVPAVVIEFTSNSNASNNVEYFYNGTATGVGFGGSFSLPLNTNTINELYLYGISPSQSSAFNFCESNTGAPNTPFTISDYASGNVIYTGTWLDDGTCDLVTLPAGSVTGTTTFSATCGACITNYDNGTGTFSPSVAGPGTHTITYTFTHGIAGCAPYVFSKTIVVGPVPQAPTTTTGASVCSGNTATISVTGTEPSYLWYSAPTGGLPLVNATSYTTPPLTTTTTYYVEAVNTSGCGSATRTPVTVTINPTPTAFSTSGLTNTICAGNSVIMGTAIPNITTNVYTVPTGGTPVGTISFTTPVLNNTITYYFETVSNLGCLASTKRDSLTIVVNPLPATPTISMLKNDSICVGLSDSIKTTPIAGVVTNVYATPTGGVSLGTLNFQTPPIVGNVTYYFETKIVSTGCLSKTIRDSVKIIALPRPAKATLVTMPNDSLCENDTIVLRSTTVPGNIVTWYATNNGNISIGKDSVVVAPKTTQYYYAEVKNTLGCKANEIRDSLKITVLPLPKAPKILGGIDKICQGDSIVLNAIVTPATSTIYWLTSLNWKDTIGKGVNFTSPILNSSTMYYVAAITKDKCKSKESDFYAVPVTVKPLPHVSISSNALNNSVYDGETIMFECTPNTYDVYKWFIDKEEVYVGSYTFETQDIKGTQSVKVQVTENGCTNWADNVLSIKTLPLSNAFSPNGDGKNDLFLKGLNLTIFNRWGQLLFEGKQGWDGKYNGAAVSAGTYYYMVKIKKTGSAELLERTGALTLILE